MESACASTAMKVYLYFCLVSIENLGECALLSLGSAILKIFFEQKNKERKIAREEKATLEERKK